MKKLCDSLEYSGPLALMCDDTKLLSALKLYWDAKEDGYFLVGGVKGPVRVADPEQVSSLLHGSNVELGSKVIEFHDDYVSLDLKCLP